MYHNTILDLLWNLNQWDYCKVSEITQFLINETSKESKNIVFRHEIIWSKWVSSEVSKSLYAKLQNFKNINISEYYNLIFSLIAYVNTSEKEIKKDFNIEEIYENIQFKWDFSFIENLLDTKLEELDFLLKWSDDLLYNGDDNTRNEDIHINETLIFNEVENVLREVREITAISWLIMQISSKNIWIIITNERFR